MSLMYFDWMFKSSEVFLRPAPPLEIYWLKRRIPMTKLASYTSWVTFYEELRVTKGPSAALGMTLYNAAATYFSILNLFS